MASTEEFQATLGALSPFLSFAFIGLSDNFEAFRHLLVTTAERYIATSTDKVLAKAWVRRACGAALLPRI